MYIRTPDYSQFNSHTVNVFCIVSLLFIPHLILHLMCCGIARTTTMVVLSDLLMISCARKKYVSNACARYYLELIKGLASEFIFSTLCN